MSNSSTFRLSPFLIILIICSGCATTAPPREVDSTADEILRAMSDTLAGAGRFSFRVRSTVDELLDEGPMVERTSESGVSVSRPDKIFAATRGGRGNREFWYDGTTLTVLDKDQNAYSTVKAPPTIDGMLDFAMDEYDLTMPLADILFSDSYTVLIENVERGVYLGLSTIGNRSCHHLAFRQQLINWQIWIETGKRSLPRKVVITYLDSPEKPSYAATFFDWDLSPKFPGGRFAFHAPSGAKPVAMDILLGQGEGE